MYQYLAHSLIADNASVFPSSFTVHEAQLGYLQSIYNLRRMSLSTCLRHCSTVKAIGIPGIQRLPPSLDSTSLAQHIAVLYTS